jgi:two-component system sensor histidine kinase QseC
MAAASLRRRLLAVLLGITASTWIAVSAVGYFEARHEAEELLDAHLAQSAGLLVAQAGEELHELDLEHAPELHRYALRTAFQIWERGQRLRLHSASAPNVRLSAVEDGFSDAVHEGMAWRVFSAWDEGHRFLIQVAERRRARDEIARSLGKALLWPMLAGLPLLAVALWVGIGRGLLPLRDLRQQLAQRGPDDLASLHGQEAPQEVQPLVGELNRLFARITETLERERRLTSDAAHELRTPLAVLSTQAQLARSASSEAVRNEALEGLVAGAERAARLADQMLTLARIESGQTGGARGDVDLLEVARTALAEVVPRALAKDVDVELDDGVSVRVNGYGGLLGVLARNLVDNAVRYTPSGGRVRVAVRREGQAARLEVIDNGVGVPPEELARLGERFHRLATADEQGSGLGLSIVKRIAELHGAAVRFSAGPGGAGLAAVVELPSV